MFGSADTQIKDFSWNYFHTLFEAENPFRGQEEHLSHYIPDGQELKFLVYSPEYSYNRLTAVYAPLDVQIKSSGTTNDVLYTNGVMYTIDSSYGRQAADSLENLTYFEQDYKKIILSDTAYAYYFVRPLVLPDHMAMELPNEVHVIFSDDTYVKIESYGVTIDELLKMAESIFK